MKPFLLTLLSLLSVTVLANNPAVVSGKVLDASTGLPLKDSHVFITDNYGTVTDWEGKFSLEIPAEYEDSNLTVTYIGYTPYLVQISSIQGNLTIGMKSSALLLAADEVIVRPDPLEIIDESITQVMEKYHESEAYTLLTGLIKKRFPEIEESSGPNEVILYAVISVLVILLVYLNVISPSRKQVNI